MADTRPGLLKRIQSAFTRQVQLAPPRQRSGVYLIAPSARPPTWSMARKDYDYSTYAGTPVGGLFANYADEGFAQNALIYSAIMYKARAANYAPFVAYSGDAETPEPLPAEHPMTQLLDQPNNYQAWPEFMQANVVYLNLAGESFVLVDRGDRAQRATGVPKALYPIRPDRINVLAKDIVQYDERGVLYPREIVGYEYVHHSGQGRTEKLPIPPEDMLHVLLPNPLDPTQGMGRGMSPIRPMARSADVDNKITKFIKSFFDHGAMFSGMLRASHELSDEQIAALRNQFNIIYGGSENWASVGVFDSRVEYERIGLSFDEMAFDTLDQRNSGRVLMTLGVPGVLINEPFSMQRATYSNIQEFRRIFWEDTFKPELTAFEVEYNNKLKTDDWFIGVDYSAVPALSRDVPELVSAAKELIQVGVPPKLAFQQMGVSIPDYVGNEASYMPLTMTVVSRGAAEVEESTEVAPITEELTDMDVVSALVDRGATPERAREIVNDLRRNEASVLPEPQKAALSGFTQEQKQAIRDGIDQRAVSWEPKFAAGARSQFEHDMRAILARTKAEQDRARERKATVVYQNILLAWRQYLSMAGEGWRETFVPLVRGVVTDQGEAWAQLYGIEFDIRNLFAEQWFEDYMLVFAQPILATTEKDLSALLQQAEREGWSIPTIQAHVTTLFQQYMNGNLSPVDFEWFEQRMPPYRTEYIARTETLRASNSGSFELFKRWGATAKEWFSTNDNRTRETHIEAGQKYSLAGIPGPIPIDDYFVVGGYNMMYPLDGQHGAPPSEFVNCRCTVLPHGDFTRVNV